MASDQQVDAKIILQAIAELKRRGINRLRCGNRLWLPSHLDAALSGCIVSNPLNRPFVTVAT
jgi:hypothetical protein